MDISKCDVCGKLVDESHVPLFGLACPQSDCLKLVLKPKVKLRRKKQPEPESNKDG